MLYVFGWNEFCAVKNRGNKSFLGFYIVPNDDIDMNGDKNNKVPHEQIVEKTTLLLGAKEKKSPFLPGDAFRIEHVKTADNLQQSH